MQINFMKDKPWTYIQNCQIPAGKNLPDSVMRIAALIEYDGSSYCGWQRQNHSPSVQAEVEKALSVVADEPILVVCAGRTDTGVHGTNQVIHFDTSATRLPRQWMLGVNANLPRNIRIHWVGDKPPQFHARFSAVSRTYRYVISNQFYRSALYHNLLTWERVQLDEKAMNVAAQCLIGEHDFTSFRASGCQSMSPNRNVHAVNVRREKKLVIFEITANSFLHHMVRNIVGSLISIGKGDHSSAWFSALLKNRDRSKASATAPSNGLYLSGVSYPPEYNIPRFNLDGEILPI